MSNRGFMISLNDGRPFYPMNPRVEDIHIEDIAHSLAQINRFNGHANFPVSVAQHSLLVCDLVLSEFKLEALMHDAAEAYVGDIVTPMKHELIDVQSWEHNINCVIKKRFKLSDHGFVHIKLADERALEIEMREATDRLSSTPQSKSFEFREMHWRDAKEAFLERFRELTA